MAIIRLYTRDGVSCIEELDLATHSELTALFTRRSKRAPRRSYVSASNLARHAQSVTSRS